MGGGLLTRAGTGARRHTLLLVVLLLAAALGGAAALPHGPLLTGVPDLPWWLLAVAFLLGDALGVEVELRRRTLVFQLTEVQLLVGLALLPLDQVLLARVVGGLLASALLWRGATKVAGNAAVSVAVGLAVSVAEVVTAAALLRLVGATHGLTGPSSWVVAPVVLVVTIVVSHVLVSCLSTAQSGVRHIDRESFVALAPFLLCVVGEGVVALLVLEVVDVPSACLALGGLGAAFGAYHRTVTRQRARFAQLQLLSHFTEALVGQVETDDVVTTVLAQAAEVLRSDRCELLLVGDAEGPSRWVQHTIDAGTLVHDGLPPPDHPALVLLRQSGAGLLVPRRCAGTQRELLTALAARNAVLVPLRRGTAVVGALVAADRSDVAQDFTRHDLDLAESLAAAATVALDKGRLFERVRHEAAVREHQVLHDALTGLPNRDLITRHLQAALGDGEVGVLLLDLDRFHDVNDSLGHDVGDRLLLKVAARLRDRLAPRFAVDGGWLSRLGGDEFAIVLPGVTEDRLLVEAEAVLAVFEEPFRLGDSALVVGASIGASCRAHSSRPGRLLQFAEIAMYDVKRRGGGCSAYVAGDEKVTRRRLELVGSLRRAVEASQLTVAYQPKVDLTTGRPVGVEALVRWTSPDHGVVGPDEFVPLAEQSGLVGALTSLVLDTALERAASWARAGRDLTVAVNVSPRGLADGSLLAAVPLLLERHGVAPDRLVLELTEGTVMSDPTVSIEVLERLAALGVGLSIDDFGTGYSSLAYLKRLPVHEVKIDRSFVLGMAGDGDDAAIVRSTVHLAHDLGLTVVAEGVEDAVAYAGLQALGCDVAQGYLLSRPLAADALETWLDRWPGHGTALLGAPPQRLPV